MNVASSLQLRPSRTEGQGAPEPPSSLHLTRGTQRRPEGAWRLGAADGPPQTGQGWPRKVRRGGSPGVMECEGRSRPWNSTLPRQGGRAGLGHGSMCKCASH